jgi:hypothetical protein
MTQNFARIHAIFGREHSLDYVQTFAKSFVNRIDSERENIKSLESLNKFISRRANNFLITLPRSINIISDPAQELIALFQEIFKESAEPIKVKRSSIEQNFLKMLRSKLKSKFDDFIIRSLPKIAVPIPGVHREIRPCAGFMNGFFNIIVKERFTPQDAFRKMSCDTIIGKFLTTEKNKIWGEQRLIILADFDSNHNEVIEQLKAFRPIMQSNDVEIYTDLQQITTKIIKEAKKLPENLRKITLTTQPNFLKDRRNILI